MNKHKIKSAQVSVVSKGRSQTFSLNTKPDTWFELASLSKTIASAFALEYFKKKNIPLNTSVNLLLDRTKSTFRLQGEWADDVTLTQLMSHTALNMHYVNGIPANQEMPNVKDLIIGNKKFGYEPIKIENQPGSVFSYSGGGFLFLEHLIESLENDSVQNLTKDFLNRLELKNLSFEQKTLPNISYAHGYLSDGREVDGSRLMFPAFAAGAMGTSSDVQLFLSHLTKAFHSLNDSGPISHDTAIQMLFGQDKGSVEFMNAKMGLGVFTAEAGPNRLMIHQGANDGFRALFVHCYSGPNQDNGFVILCNGDNNGVSFVSEVAQLLLQELNIQGVDTSKFKTQLNLKDVRQEEIVNRGYQELVFGAFEPDLPEEIIKKGPVDPMSALNLAVGAKVLKVTDQKFARASNLVSNYLPIFDPELFGRQGKIMDSWETVRHNPLPHDELVLELRNPANIHYVSLSTKYHLGNQPQSVRIEGRSEDSQEWKDLVPKTDLEGHALKNVKSQETKTRFHYIRVSMYPDGGLSRLSLYGENIPGKKDFLDPDIAPNLKFDEKIPHSKKPLAPKYETDDVQKNWGRLSLGDEVNVASLAYGAKIVSASNEHYGPAIQVISPFPPLHMFDGSESARSRKKDHSEEIVIQLGMASLVHRIEIDFKFFRNNNPRELKLEALTKDDQWITLQNRTFVKPYAGNAIAFGVDERNILRQIKVTVFPDGGMNRIRVFSRV